MASRFPNPKDPDERLDYTLDWSSWLPSGDTIAASLWSVPDGITEDGTDFNDTHTVIWLTGGTAGNRYDLVNTITTEDGRIAQRTVELRLRNK